jgi:hypothetical protein
MNWHECLLTSCAISSVSTISTRSSLREIPTTSNDKGGEENYPSWSSAWQTVAAAKYPAMGFRSDARRKETRVTKLRAPLLGRSLTMLLSAGCAAGPNDKRPSADVPGMYRGAAPQEGAQAAAAQSFGDQKWWELFQDTPGLGSVFTDNPAATEACIPYIDAMQSQSCRTPIPACHASLFQFRNS